MNDLIKNKKKGILFWITGFSGSGKTSISKILHKHVIKIYGPTLLINGDDLRKIFNLNGYTLEDRKKISKKYCKFVKFITNQNINIIFTVVGMMDEPRRWNQKNIKNYLEIYIKSNLKQIILKNKKKIYHKKKNLVGVNIKPQIPKEPHIILNNNFKKNTKELASELLDKIKKKISYS